MGACAALRVRRGVRLARRRAVEDALLDSSDPIVDARCIAGLLGIGGDVLLLPRRTAIDLSAVLDQIDDRLRPRLLRGSKSAPHSPRTAQWISAAPSVQQHTDDDAPAGGLGTRFLASAASDGLRTSPLRSSGVRQLQSASDGAPRDDELTPKPHLWAPLRMSEPPPSPGHLSERAALLMHIVLVSAQLVCVMGTFLLPAFRRTVNGVVGFVFDEIGVSFDTDVNFVEMTVLVRRNLRADS
jgi:hypothetical protein